MRSEIIQEARDWINTPYHNQARVKHIGVDCAQLIAGVAIESGIMMEVNVPAYSPEWQLHNKEEKMLGILEDFGCTEIRTEDALPGDILCFQFGRVCSHLGILVEPTRFVHARIDIGKVVEHELSGDWVKRLKKVYKFPNIS